MALTHRETCERVSPRKTHTNLFKITTKTIICSRQLSQNVLFQFRLNDRCKSHCRHVIAVGETRPSQLRRFAKVPSATWPMYV